MLNINKLFVICNIGSIWYIPYSYYYYSYIYISIIKYQ